MPWKKADKNESQQLNSRGEVEASFVYCPSDSAAFQFQEEDARRTHAYETVLAPQTTAYDKPDARASNASPRASSLSRQPKARDETTSKGERGNDRFNTWTTSRSSSLQRNLGDVRDVSRLFRRGSRENHDGKFHRPGWVKKLTSKPKKERPVSDCTSSLSQDVFQELMPAVVECGLDEQGGAESSDEAHDTPSPKSKRPEVQAQESHDPTLSPSSSTFSVDSSADETSPLFDEQVRHKSYSEIVERAIYSAAEKHTQQSTDKTSQADEKPVETASMYKQKVIGLQSQLDAELLKNEQLSKDIDTLQRKKQQVDDALIRVCTTLTVPEEVEKSVNDLLRSENEILAVRAHKAEAAVIELQHRVKELAERSIRNEEHLKSQYEIELDTEKRKMAAAEHTHTETLTQKHTELQTLKDRFESLERYLDEMTATVIANKPGEALTGQANIERLCKQLEQKDTEIALLKQSAEHVSKHGAQDGANHVAALTEEAVRHSKVKSEELSKTLYTKEVCAVAETSAEDVAIQQLNDQISAKDKLIIELQYRASTGSCAQELEDEVDDLKSDLARLVGLLQAEKSNRKRNMHTAAEKEAKLEGRIMELELELSNTQSELQPELLTPTSNAQPPASEEVREGKQQLEMEPRKATEAKLSQTIRQLQAEVTVRDDLLQLTQSVQDGTEEDAFEKMKQQYLDNHFELVQLKKKLQEYESQQSQSQQQTETLETPVPLRARSLTTEDMLHSDLSSSAQIKQLKIALKVKKRKIDNLEVAAWAFQPPAREQRQSSESAALQSKTIVDLNRELEQAKLMEYLLKFKALFEEEKHALEEEMKAAHGSVQGATNTAIVQGDTQLLLQSRYRELLHANAEIESTTTKHFLQLELTKESEHLKKQLVDVDVQRIQPAVEFDTDPTHVAHPVLHPEGYQQTPSSSHGTTEPGQCVP